MVLYFESDAVSPSAMIYMGKDKFENEELIKFGFEEDVWFHVDKLSSAHVYLRQQKGASWEDIPELLLQDLAQLTKANSIEGNKKDNITVIYTPWANLKKTQGMETGQVTFHKNTMVKRIHVQTRANAIINRLNKTKEEREPDLANEKVIRAREDRDVSREMEKKQRQQERAEKEAKRIAEETKSYSAAMKERNMKSNRRDLDESAKRTPFKDAISTMSSLIKPNPTLDTLCRFLNSVRGTDKVLMLMVYASKIGIYALHRKDPKSPIAVRLQNLIGPASDTRMLLRYYGLLPMYQWILYSEAHPAATSYLQTLIRLQNLANVLYYPLEHAYWLGAHNVIPMSEETRDKVFGLWSSRFWALYVVLYFAQLWEEHKILLTKEVALEKRIRASSKSGDDSVKVKQTLGEQKVALADERKTLMINFVINAAYFPLTIHWSVEASPFPEIGVGICGTVAALAQIYTAWIASC
ncbi:hypothetical protein SmJEL517_g03858 [Synchytrium microbalum]|uniref:NFACT RNA-binding domain-containing protein n=1 Tax=Synchytrium microbalum TaxID=1806994 RepID=A0A507C1F5_9FUNG|nr:uncharacterized protein SmJEL517_g03858 [Synchytrium microbalum]TPX33198.1 hypothetical protein SmJEL517_g03858 [Synchytrium microbalum]